MKLVLLLFFMVCAQFNAHANWYVNNGLTGDSRKLIDDNEYSFELANVNCKVSKTDIKERDNGISELRTLTCDLGNNTQVQKAVLCVVSPKFIPLGNSFYVQIIKDNILQSVSLTCLPP